MIIIFISTNQKNMLFVEVKKGNIEKALKELKGKVIKTKQNSKLFESL